MSITTLEQLYGTHIQEGEYLMVVLHRKDQRLGEYSKLITSSSEAAEYISEALEALADG